MNYDDYKTQTPEETPPHNCQHCEKPIEQEGYCSTQCLKADMR